MKFFLALSVSIGMLACSSINCHGQIGPSFVEQLYTSGIFVFGDYTLKNGKASHFYCDMRRIMSYPALFAQLNAAVKHVAQEIACDCIAGVPYGAVPFATACALHLTKPLIMPRKERKNHGLCNTVEGAFEPGNRVLLIEELMSTGSSIEETIALLDQHGLVIEDVIVLLDRQAGGIERLRRAGYRVHALLTLSDVANELKSLGRITSSEYEQLLTETVRA